jgi:hypothetical protein
VRMVMGSLESTGCASAGTAMKDNHNNTAKNRLEVPTLLLLAMLLRVVFQRAPGATYLFDTHPHGWLHS